MRKVFLLILLANILLIGLSKNDDKNPVYKDKKHSVKERVQDLLKRMTLEEKIDLISGTGFDTRPIERLEIPEMKMADGPLGVRLDKATAFPSGIAMAATWNPDLIWDLGKALGEETKGKGRNIILGPCVNIARIPQGGRNFESFGEDPFLTSSLAVPYIKGVRSTGVAATVKHFACNNQEHERDYVDVKIDERALNEIYLPAFKASVLEADVLTFMSSYNKINGPYASENDYLLVNKLKGEWGFQGLVMSDWGAVHSSIPTYNSGLDLEMPTGKYLNQDSLLPKIKSGELDEEKLNDKVSRILTVMFKLGMFDKETKGDASLVNNSDHKKIAYNVEKEAIVLLKNSNNILPIKKDIKTIAVIGPNANVARTGGGGSSMVTPYNSTSIFDGLKSRLGSLVKIDFAKGVSFDGEAVSIPSEAFYLPGENKNGIKAEYYDNKDLSGDPKLTRIDHQINFNWEGGSPASSFKNDKYSVRWTSELSVPKSGEYILDVSSDDGTRLWFNDKMVINDWKDHAVESRTYKVKLDAGKRYKFVLEYFENGGSASVKFGWVTPGEDIFKTAKELAEKSDLVVLCLGTSSQHESEGRDRNDLVLPSEQDSLVEEISKINKNIIVVLSSGSAVLMNKWIEKVDAIVQTWFGGEELGNATADVLLGIINPSGKLPVTFPKNWEDCSAFGTYKKQDSITVYSDGIFVGYRHFDKNNIEPLFPFGFGLTYTSFEYSNLSLSSKEILDNGEIEVSFTIKNTGKIVGSEVCQLYIHDVVSSLEKANKELKGYKKVNLHPGESKTIKLKINSSSLSHYDVESKKFLSEKGEFEVLVGSSSKDIQLKEKFFLK